MLSDTYQTENELGFGQKAFSAAAVFLAGEETESLIDSKGLIDYLSSKLTWPVDFVAASYCLPGWRISMYFPRQNSHCLFQTTLSFSRVGVICHRHIDICKFPDGISGLV